MTTTDLKIHWETVYETKEPQELSWFQTVPLHSANAIQRLQIPLDAAIIDIGGGDSLLADYLLQQGFSDITVLDISAKSIARAQERLGENAGKINWVVSDILEFQPARQYAYWHDRATFHFLTNEAQVQQYLNIVSGSVSRDGYFTIGTFSETGPQKCSGLKIRQYSEQSLSTTFSADFRKLFCTDEQHITPFGTVQDFIFCNFQKG